MKKKGKKKGKKRKLTANPSTVFSSDDIWYALNIMKRRVPDQLKNIDWMIGEALRSLDEKDVKRYHRKIRALLSQIEEVGKYSREIAKKMEEDVRY